MTLADRIRTIVAAMPAAGSITLPVAELATWLEDDGAPPPDASSFVADLTAEDVAEQLERTPACVRNWCRQGRIPGAYRLNGREWRIPRGGLRAYLEGARGPRGTPPAHGAPIDLGAWRGGKAS